jgi:hypothetical protein
MPFDSERPGDTIAPLFAAPPIEKAPQSRALPAERGTDWTHPRAQMRRDRHATVSAPTASQPGLPVRVAGSPQLDRS